MAKTNKTETVKHTLENLPELICKSADGDICVGELTQEYKKTRTGTGDSERDVTQDDLVGLALAHGGIDINACKEYRKTVEESRADELTDEQQAEFKRFVAVKKAVSRAWKYDPLKKKGDVSKVTNIEKLRKAWGKCTHAEKVKFMKDEGIEVAEVTE